MNIYYRNSPLFLEMPGAVRWEPGTLINGNTSIQNEDGTYLSVQPDGSFQTRTAIGPWELCTLDASANLVRYAATGITYPVPIHGR